MTEKRARGRPKGAKNKNSPHNKIHKTSARRQGLSGEKPKKTAKTLHPSGVPINEFLSKLDPNKQPQENQKIDPPETEPVKRGRGRPRKPVEAVAEGVEKGIENKDGRPRKVVETLSDTVGLKSTLNESGKVRLKYDPSNPSVRKALPHIFGFKWYAWSRAFFESTNRLNLLCAANQISKSSTQIRKCIDWATNTKKWESLWPGRRPRIFWYMYPSNPVLKVEFEKKWVEEFLPKNGFERDEHFGYTVERTKKEIKAIHFFSGVSVYFKTYAQGADNLQTATVDAVFTDEELPEEIYDEVKARLIATKGYFHMVFTATLNQDMWRRALEGEGDNELFPDAFKIQVSMYDCLFYDDNTPSMWTKERIREVELDCKSDIEVRRRVYGKFVSESGRKYPNFDSTKHFMTPVKVPENWDYYVGADIGSGGSDGHPAALCYIAVRPDKQLGYVIDGWRGDGVVTTAGDVLEKHVEMRPRNFFARQVYDWQSKDFKTIAGRVGEAVGCWEMANKGHSEGESTLNTLFRNNMLFIFDTAELRKLGSELSSLMKKTLKANAKDDFADAFRYAAMSVPWDFTAISKDFKHEEIEEKAQSTRPLTDAEVIAQQIQDRRGGTTQKPTTSWAEIEDDISEWNEAYGT